IARTVEDGIHVAEGVFDRLEAIGVDMDDVGRVLEDEGVAAFAKSFDELLGVLERKSAELTS
ncbi:MAG: transaldolase, partial [Acidimicrobiia bacterium]|nr:transaldolase [Acidimicrobiia bacterium]